MNYFDSNLTMFSSGSPPIFVGYLLMFKPPRSDFVIVLLKSYLLHVQLIPVAPWISSTLDNFSL